jgi:hypothetical protein
VSDETDGAPEASPEAELREQAAQGDGAPGNALRAFWRKARALLTPGPRWTALAPRPEIAIALGGGAVVLIAVNVLLIGVSRSEAPFASPVASVSAPPLARSQTAVAAAPNVVETGAPTVLPEAPAPPASDDPAPNEAPPSHEKPTKKTKGRTVQWAAERACSTAHVDGLSRQIIEESRCLEANAFARVPLRQNLSSPAHVFLYLDAPARDHLMRALSAHPDRILKVHSALRTVAQQYLLSRWAAGKRCGVQLANRPGESNHETGLALDVGGHTEWRSALESEGFRWLGSIDRVHFDYVGADATHHEGLDVRAFQRLWNRNHPDDAIAESGTYDHATEQRLKRSPAGGFPSGPRCGGGSDHRVASGGSGRGHGR